MTNHQIGHGVPGAAHLPASMQNELARPPKSPATYVNPPATALIKPWQASCHQTQARLLVRERSQICDDCGDIILFLQTGKAHLSAFDVCFGTGKEFGKGFFIPDQTVFGF